MAVSFLDELAAGTADALLADSRSVVVPRGSWLFHEGDTATETFLITDGIVKIVKVAPDGTQALLALRPAGALIGELSLMAGRQRSAGALAAVPTKVRAIRQDRLVDVMSAEPAVARTIIATLSTRLRDASMHILELATGDVTELVRRRLLELATSPEFAVLRSEGADGSTVIALPLSQHEIAAWAGVSPRTVAGVLRGLRQAGAIETSRMELIVYDVDALREQPAPDEP